MSDTEEALEALDTLEPLPPLPFNADLVEQVGKNIWIQLSKKSTCVSLLHYSNNFIELIITLLVLYIATVMK